MTDLPEFDEETLRELRAVLGPEFALLVDTFVADGERRLAACRAALSAQDAAALREVAHSFKGSSLNVGARRLAGHCLDIETRARHGELEGLGARLDAADAAFRSAVCGLRRR